MELNFFIKGVILGFSIAAPVGPIGILCIQKSVHYGRWAGLCSGLGAAVADTIYGIIAAFGLAFISNFLLEEQFWLRLIGGAFLIYLGLRTFSTKSSSKSENVTQLTLIKDFVSTFFLTMTNPMTIFSYLAIFAGLGIANIHGEYSNAAWLVCGVFIGSTLWWITLSEGVTLFRKKVSGRVMVWINRIAGLLIISFGIMAWIAAAYEL